MWRLFCMTIEHHEYEMAQYESDASINTRFSFPYELAVCAREARSEG